MPPGRRGGGRLVYIPRLRDQVVLKALSAHLAAQMAAHGIGLPPSRPQDMIRRVIHEGRLQGREHIFKTDIHAYYESIPHKGLFEALQRLELEPQALALIQQLLTETPARPWAFGRGQGKRRQVGVPTGLSIASLLGQLFLSVVDQAFAAREDMLYLRYTDDVFLAARDHAGLSEGIEALRAQLDAAGLELRPSKSHRGRFATGFNYLGFRFHGDRLLIPEEKTQGWTQRLLSKVGRQRSDILGAQDRADASHKLRLLVNHLNRELSGAEGMHLPYYSMGENLELYRAVDTRIRHAVSALTARWNLGLRGELRVASAYGWAWRHKKGRHQARQDAESRYPRAED